MMLGFLKRTFSKLSEETGNGFLLGVPVKTVKGTIRNKEDYDDAWFLALARKSQVIFDIGCNSGYTALLALVSDPDKQILLADANPLAIAKAMENLAINNLINNARAFIGFVSDKADERIDFYTIGAGAAGSMFKSHAKTAGAANLSVSVNTTTIDNLTKQYNMIPDFVKVDVEGAESFVLAGSIELASRKASRFLVEMHSSSEMSMTDNAKKVLQWCAENGFSAWYMKEQMLLQKEDQIAHRGKCHLLLQPEGWSYPDFLVNIRQSDPLHSAL